MHGGNSAVLEQNMSIKLDKEYICWRHFRKVKVSNDKETAKTDRNKNSHSKKRGKKNLNLQQPFERSVI